MDKFLEILKTLLEGALAFLAYSLGRTREHEKMEKEALGRALTEANDVYKKRDEIKTKVDSLKSRIPNDWGRVPKPRAPRMPKATKA